jgi:uncharacterized membrane protein
VVRSSIGDAHVSKDTSAPGGDAGYAVEGVVVDGDGGTQSAGIVAANTDRALVVAQFPDPDAAMETYQALIDAETSGHLSVDGVLVVRAEADGRIVIQKVTDHSTRTGVKWGVVGGVVLGVIFPPSVIGSAVALGVTGGVLGKLRQRHHKADLADSLAKSLAPNTSGILVLASLPAVGTVRQTMPRASRITEVSVDSDTAAAITEAAKAAG